MSRFFFQIVTDAVNYDDTDTQKELFALNLSDMREWCEKQIDLSEISNQLFVECVLNDLFQEGSEFPYELYRHIQTFCMPDEEEDDAIVTGVKCKKCTNVLPPHTIAEHMTKTHPIHTCPHQVTK